MSRHALRWSALLIAPVLLASCHSGKRGNQLDALDNSLTADNSDAALTGALNDQIMVDPNLTQQSNNASVRPPAKPYSAEVPPAGTAAGGKVDGSGLKHAPAPGNENCPQCSNARGALTLGELASRQKAGGIGGCSKDVQYSADWVGKLGDLPVYPGGHVVEAAGNNRSTCRLRIVSFTTPASADQVVDWYYTQATKAGYDADQQTDGSERVLGGTRPKDGGAYVIFVDPSDGGGSSVDLVVNNGT